MRPWLSAILATLIASVALGDVSSLRYTIVPTPSSKIDTRYRDGNDGSAAIPLTWSTVPAVSVSTGATGSRTDRSYLSEPGSPNATLSISCTPTLAGGFTLGTNGLQWSSTTAYAGVCTETATRNGAVALSNQFNVSAIAPAGSDTTAPTVPTGLSVTAGVGTLTYTFNASSDPFTSEAGSGVASYDLYNGSTIIANIAASAGLSQQLTSSTLGSFTPTASATRVGTEWTLIASGSIDGTGDMEARAKTSIAGDATASVYVASQTSVAAYPKSGLEVRGADTDTSARFSCYQMGTYVQSQARNAESATTGSVATTAVGAGTKYLRIVRVGNTFKCQYSTDGLAWIDNVSNYVLALPTTAYWGLFSTSTEGSGGATNTSVFQQFSMNNVADVSYQYSTASAVTASIRANDVAGNHSAYSASVAGTPTGSSSSQAIKFHPGTYLWYAPGAVAGVSGFRIDLPTQRTQLLAFMDTVCSDDDIKGFQVAAYWRTLEGNSAGDYSPGFTALDAVMSKAAACSKYISLNIFTAHFGNIASIYDVYPAYLVDGASYGITNFHSPQVGGAARLWQQATMDRFIALSAAYATRYNSHANFEMFGGGETSLAIDEGTDGYTIASLRTQLSRFFQVGRSQWANTGIRLAANDMGADSNLVTLFADAATYQITIGGPDIWPGDITQADRIFVGKNSVGSNVYTDYRGTMPWMSEVQWQSFSGQWTMQQLYDAPMSGYSPTNGDFTMPSMHPSYFVWYVNEVNGNSSTQWNTAILPLIHNVNGEVYPRGSLSNVPCPTSYSSCTRN